MTLTGKTARDTVWDQCYKTYHGRNLQVRVFVPGQLFQPSPIFVSNAGAHPIEELFRCSTLGQASDPALKLLTRLDKEKHSSLLRKSVICGRQKFYDVDTRSAAAKETMK
jgi:hypothetical protein